MKKMVKAVVFDMDGTLVDNMIFHKQAWSDFLNKHGVSVTEEDFMQKNHGIITEIVPRFFPQELSPEETLQLGFEKEMIYRNLYKPHIKPIEGLAGFLQKLQEAGLKLALAAGMRVVALTTMHSREGISPYPLLKIIDNYQQISLSDL